MTRLRIVILGAAAGGGLPQWNCRCSVCSIAWSGEERVKPRTQSSIAVSADGENWALVNCAPEILAQLQANPVLHPRAGAGRRHSPIKAALVTNGDIDHVAGLLSLREGQSFVLHATAEIHSVLRANAVFDVLAPDMVERRTASFSAPFEIVPGLEAEIFPVPGKTALYLEGERVDVGAEGEATIGVAFRAGGRSAFYIPGCARMSEALAARLKGADTVLFDGTVFTDDEMAKEGVGTKTGRRMGHMPMSGEGSSLEAFAPLDVGRKIYVHINNTNPVLIEDSAERRAVEAAGWEVAHDGLEVTP